MTVEEIIKEPGNLFKLYAAYKSLPDSYRTTIFDILNVSERENVISDLLAFLFDPNEVHGLEDVWIESLLSVYLLASDIGDNNSNLMSEKGSFIVVQREFHTKTGRIDIIVEFENLCIVIENKINHDPINDFLEYQNYALNKYSNVIFVLLTLRPEENNLNFINVTYSKFLPEVQKRIGYKIADANNSFLGLIKDFITNMQNLTGDNIKMETVDFYIENHDLINNLKNSLDGFIKNQFDKILSRLFDDIVEYMNSDSDFASIGLWKKRDEGKSSYKIVGNSNYPSFKFFDFDLSKLLSANKYIIQISTSNSFSKNQKFKDDLREFCNNEVSAIFTKLNKFGIGDWGTQNHTFIGKEYNIPNNSILKLNELIINILQKDWKPVLNEIKLIMDRAKELEVERKPE